jgi:ABC-type uncharacterized transport system involved in gliding motility auxiliary subunit
MQIDRHTLLQLRAQGILFHALFAGLLGLVAYLSTRYVHESDWTAAQRNSLSQASIDLLKTLGQPVAVTAYARDNDALRDAIRDALGKYQKHKPDISLEFVNPDTAPDRVRSEGITVDGELVVAYAGRSERLTSRSESDLTNALQRLARSGERFVVFVEGHGERDPLGERNHDLGTFGQQLAGKGFRLQTLNLASAQVIPDNTAVLVIAGPATDLLPVEQKLVLEFVTRGGNLLWLGDPGPVRGLDALAKELGITFLPGLLVDQTAQLMGIDDPALILVSEYPQHPVTRDFRTISLFPQTTALDWEAPVVGEGWRGDALLNTLPRAWLETGALAGAVRFDANTQDRQGPLSIAWALTRNVPAKDPAAPALEQRVVVMGDGDFLSNAFLGNGGNLDLGLNLFNWLAHDDAFINIAVKEAEDIELNLSETQLLVISLMTLLGLPLLLIASGVSIWWRRRGR